MNKLVLFQLIALSLAIFGNQQVESEATREIWHQYFNEINEQLAKTVGESSDLGTLLAAASSLESPENPEKNEVHAAFHELQAVTKESRCSQEMIDLLRNVDDALDDSHLDADHLVRPIDLIAQHYGFMVYRLCHGRHVVNYGNLFMGRAYSQLFDIIGSKNLDEANLRNLAAKTKAGGMLQRASDQLLALRGFISNEEISCEVKDYDILLRNLLAFKAVEAGPWNKHEDILKLLGPYMLMRAEVCLPGNLQRFESAAQSLDKQTLNTLSTLSLAFSPVLVKQLSPMESYSDLRAELNWADVRKKLRYFVENLDILSIKASSFYQKLSEALTRLASHDSDMKRITESEDDFDMDVFKGLLQRYIVEPCVSATRALDEQVQIAQADNQFIFMENEGSFLARRYENFLPRQLLAKADAICQRINLQGVDIDTLSSYFDY